MYFQKIAKLILKLFRYLHRRNITILQFFFKKFDIVLMFASSIARYDNKFDTRLRLHRVISKTINM